MKPFEWQKAKLLKQYLKRSNNIEIIEREIYKKTNLMRFIFYEIMIK
jgi:hypothetical protein